MNHTKQWKRHEWLVVKGTNDLLVMSLNDGRGEFAINNEPHIFITLFQTRMSKNYLIFLKHCLALRFNLITFV